MSMDGSQILGCVVIAITFASVVVLMAVFIRQEPYDLKGMAARLGGR